MTIESANVVTVGKLCELLQAGPGQVRAAAQAADVKPVLTINGTMVYFDESDVGRIRAALNKPKRSQST
ncbi:MAG TPA: hypothetical protein VHD36_12075 [Pirellulales bacterium]|nr:hypothetical protein [Pirellulales bacterium]